MRAIAAVTTPGATAVLCHSVGLSRASFYRRRRPTPSLPPPPSHAPSPRALAADERQAMLDTLHSERFVDQSPAEVHATLLEEQTYLGSVRTMYRVLAEAHEVRERRAQAPAPGVYQTRARGDGPESGLVLGHHQAQGPDPVPLLLALCDPRPLQPLRRGLDGRPPRECAPGGTPACGDLPETGHRPASNSRSMPTAARPCGASSSRCSSRT